MCSVSAPKPKTIETPEPTFVRNPFLDELDADVSTADALRRGRDSLVIGFEGRTTTSGNVGQGGTNGRRPIGNSGSGPFGSGPATIGGPRGERTGPRRGNHIRR